MSRPKKIILISGIIVATLLLVAMAAGYIILRQGLPRYTMALNHARLQEKVTVYRDERGVPHIYASSVEDMVFAQGYVHAQERLWQMETHRRFVQARLSELIGESLLETDILLRTVGLDRLAKRVLEKTSPDGRLLLQAYADGINAYLEHGKLPPEFIILGLQPEPWTAEDCAGSVALLGYNLGGNWQDEMIRLALQEALDQELFDELVPPYAGWETPRVWTEQKAGLTGEGVKTVQNLLKLLAAGNLTDIAPLPSTGSNSWVVSPELSATGTAVLANDPHLTISLPSIWFENHLSTDGDLEVYGWSIPGAPGVVIGFNNYIAWGMTNIGDSQDLYLEEQDPANPRRFKYDEQWYEAQVFNEEIRVRGREPEQVEVIVTRNGPLLSSDPPISLRWAAYEIEKSTVDAILGLNRAENWDDFIAALDHFTLPIQTLVYADVEGNIGFRVVGMVPIRKEGHGVLPMPGWLSEHSWQGYIPMGELPQLFNPPDGFIATANHRVEGDEYPYIIDLEVAPPYRMQRIVDVLSARNSFTVKDFEELQNDWFNQHAAERLPEWLEILASPPDQPTANEAQGLALLQEWAVNPINLPEAAAPAIFQTWYLNFMEEVFGDEMGDELYQQFIGSSYLAYNALEYLLQKGESAWFTGGLEPLLWNSYRRTISDLQEKFGGEPENWQWSRLQTITFNHVMGDVAVLSPLVNRGPFPYGGDHMTVGRAGYSLTSPFKVNMIAGMRFIAVMEKGDVRVRGVVAGGQSGHILSRHYDDQIQTWLAGDYYDLLFSRDALLKTDPQIMELE